MLTNILVSSFLSLNLNSTPFHERIDFHTAVSGMYL